MYLLNDHNFILNGFIFSFHSSIYFIIDIFVRPEATLEPPITTIAMKRDFIPVTNDDLHGWEQRFAAKLATHAAELGLNVTQVTTVVDLIATHRTQFTEAYQAKATAKAKVSAMQRGKVRTVKAIRNVVRAIKASPAYTESMGKEMAIIGPEDSREIKAPVLRVKLNGTMPVISYRKGKTDGIQLQSRRSGETEFTFLAVDSQSPYTDKRPNLVAGTPEAREYRACYLKGDQPIGQIGQISVVLVGGF